jgi:hypothetical protein
MCHMQQHDNSRPWAAQTPRLGLTWVMTPHGLQMRWIAVETPAVVDLGQVRRSRQRGQLAA